MLHPTMKTALNTAARHRSPTLPSTTLRALGSSSKEARGPKVMPAPSPDAPVPPAPSATETQMPWNGWFSSFLLKQLGPERYTKLKNTILWEPNDIHNLEGIPRPNTKVPISKDGKLTAQFRYPSPGSRKPVNIPAEDDGEDPYFIAHYVRDTRRRGLDPANPKPEVEKMKVAMLPQDDPRVEELREKMEQGPGSSPGNKGRFATGQTDYDPKGLRATMSANWESMNESLDKYTPNHLPTASWENDQDAIIAKWEALGLPVPPGRFEVKVPRHRRVARWGSEFGGGLVVEDTDYVKKEES